MPCENLTFQINYAVITPYAFHSIRCPVHGQRRQPLALTYRVNKCREIITKTKQK